MFKTILQSVAVSVVSVGVGFILSILLARLLGPEARGIYGTALTVAILIAGFSQLGLAHGYVYHKRLSGMVGWAVIMQSCVVIGIVAILLLVIFKQFFIQAELLPYVVLLIFLSLANTYHSYFQNSAQIDDKLYFYNVLKVVLPLLNVIFITVYYLVTNELTVNVCLVVLVFTTLFSAGFLAFNVLSQEFSTATRCAIKTKLKFSHIVGYSSKIYGTSATGIFINSIDKIVLLGSGTMKEFGLYSVAFGLSRMIGIIPETLSTVVYSRFAGKNESELGVVVKRLFSTLFLPLLSFCFLLSLMASWLIVTLFGEDYAPAAWPFIILAFESVIASLGWLLSQRFNASGRPGLVFFRQVVSTIPLVVIIFYPFEMNILLVVSLALLLSSILRLVMTFVLYRKVLHESAPTFYPTLSEIKASLSVFRKE